MGSDHNRFRRKWQDYGGGNAAVAEAAFFDSFQKVFQDTEYRIRAKPKEFQRIYVDVPLSEQEISEIYNPAETITRHGVFPDYAIDNSKTKKTLRWPWQCTRKVVQVLHTWSSENSSGSKRHRISLLAILDSFSR